MDPVQVAAVPKRPPHSTLSIEGTEPLLQAIQRVVLIVPGAQDVSRVSTPGNPRLGRLVVLLPVQLLLVGQAAQVDQVGVHLTGVVDVVSLQVPTPPAIDRAVPD